MRRFSEMGGRVSPNREGLCVKSNTNQHPQKRQAPNSEVKRSRIRRSNMGIVIRGKRGDTIIRMTNRMQIAPGHANCVAKKSHHTVDEYPKPKKRRPNIERAQSLSLNSVVPENTRRPIIMYGFSEFSDFGDRRIEPIYPHIWRNRLAISLRRRMV